MQSKAEVARAQQWTRLAAGDYSMFTEAELIGEAANLHAVLAAAPGFSRLAERAVRDTSIERLLLIDAEHLRRRSPVSPAPVALPAPRSLRPVVASDRPAAA